MNIHWIEGPYWRLAALVDKARAANVHVIWCRDADCEQIDLLSQLALDPFGDSKLLAIFGRECLEVRGTSSLIEDLLGACSRLTVVVYNCPKSVAPNLKRVADEGGSSRKWETSCDSGGVGDEMDRAFGKKLPEQLTQRLIWCLSRSSFSESIDTDIVHLECEKLSTTFHGKVPSEDEVVLSCFRQRGEGMRFVSDAVESKNADALVKEVSRAERLLGSDFVGFALSASVQLWKSTKLDAMRSSSGWSREAALDFKKVDREGNSSPAFHPRSVDKIDKSHPKVYGKAMAAALIVSKFQAERPGNDLAFEIWKTKFYLSILLAAESIDPKTAFDIFNAWEVS